MKVYASLEKLGNRSKCYFSFAMSRTDLIDIITAAGAAKATIYDKMAEAQKKSRGLRYHNPAQTFAPDATSKAIVAIRKADTSFLVMLVSPITTPKISIENRTYPLFVLMVSAQLAGGSVGVNTYESYAEYPRISPANIATTKKMMKANRAIS